jgi:hypothetical protein
MGRSTPSLLCFVILSKRHKTCIGSILCCSTYLTSCLPLLVIIVADFHILLLSAISMHCRAPSSCPHSKVWGGRAAGGHGRTLRVFLWVIGGNFKFKFSKSAISLIRKCLVPNPTQGIFFLKNKISRLKMSYTVSYMHSPCM